MNALQHKNRLVAICYNVSAAMNELREEMEKEPTNIRRHYRKFDEQRLLLKEAAYICLKDMEV